MNDLNALTLEDLYFELRRDGLITRLFELARDEDLGPNHDSTGAGDVTGKAAFATLEQGHAQVVARQPGVLAGQRALNDLLHAFRADCDYHPLAADGDQLAPGQHVGQLTGSLRAIVAVERTLLNTLGRLSGIATRTAQFVDAVKPTRARILDTRKTTPGLRRLEKYAVRCGGGDLHRLGLYDAALIKDNHLAGVAPADLPAAVARLARRAHDHADRDGLRFTEVEVDTLDQLQALLAQGGANASIILLDNMTPDQLRAAVALRDRLAPAIRLEASGGITLDNVRAIADTGVDRLSLGTLTHGARWLDFGLDR